MNNNKYVFIDRDGVINKDPAGCTRYGYVTGWEDFHIIPGVVEAIKTLTEAGYKIIIISNQQGVGKGYFSRADLDEITVKLKDTIKQAGGEISDVYYCTHLKEEKCGCRKPNSGLFQIAKKELGIESLSGKFFIGDTESDMCSGKKVGMGTILVLTGKSSAEDAESWQCKPDHICNDLLDAARLIMEDHGE
ncbi:MAG: HAD family hydrolase [Candidatus Omnitrophota bacterium]